MQSLHQHHLHTPPCTKRQKRTHIVLNAYGRSGNKQQQANVAVPTPAPPANVNNPLKPIAIASAVAAIVYAIRNGKNIVFYEKPRGRAIMDDILDGAAAENSKEYRMALARTRQAMAVHKAIGFMNTGNPPRAMVEVRRALHENSVCRSPVLSTQWTRKEVQDLYALHLQNAPVPADFATLLQLRTLLDLDFDEAERIETELMEQGSAYTI